MCPVPSDIQYTTILVFLYLRCLREWIIILWLQKNRKIFFLSHTSPKYLCIISESIQISAYKNNHGSLV